MASNVNNVIKSVNPALDDLNITKNEYKKLFHSHL